MLFQKISPRCLLHVYIKRALQIVYIFNVIFSAFSLEHAVHNVSIHLEFIRRRRYRKKSISNNINILSTLHDKVRFVKERNSCSLITIIYIRSLS